MRTIEQPDSFKADLSAPGASQLQEEALLNGDENDTRVVLLNGRPFEGIRRVGFVDSGAFVLDFYTTPPPMPRGGFFTGIPISPAEYRAEHSTKCAFRDNGHEVVVWCDWGHPHRIGAERDVLDSLIANIRANDVPEIGPEAPRAALTRALK